MYKVDMTSQDNIQTDVFESNISRLDNRNQLSSVLINKKNELSPHYKRLIDFLKEYKVKKGETENYESIRNFCNLAIKQNYAIPDNRIPKLMDLLETCRINDLRLNFTEYQNEKSSGIMYDFDILLKEEKSVVPFIKFDELITSIVDVFFNTINFRIPVPDDFDSQLDEEARLTKHAVIIKKTALVYKEDSKKYKDGFHLIFPDIKISRNFKKFLLKQIMTNTNIATQFSKLGLKLNEVLDTHSASVPLFLYGSSKVGGIPYELHEMYYFNIYSNRVEDVRTVDVASYTNCNLVYDFSLNHKFERGIIKEKTRYLPQEAVSNDIEIFNDHHKYKFDDNELNEVNRDITLKNLYIPDMDYMQAILSILSVERLSNYDTWLKLIIALANTSHDYKELAIWISKRVPEKWDPVLFENTWNNIINSKTEDGNKLSIRSIEYWAKEDNPAKRKELQDKSIIQLINDDIYDTFICGDLQQKQFAKYLHHMFKHKFITDIKYKERTHSWFEFMLPTDDHQGSNLFKWRDEDKSPDSLLMYLGEKFIYILKEIYDQISQRIDDESDTIMLKYLTTIKKNLQKCVKKLFTPKFKSDIIKEAGLMFRKRGFIDSLDKDKHLLGVENGILDLNNIELINYYHDYPVTCSTGIRYIPYDSTNRYIIEIEQVIKNLFPDDEMDVHEFLMYYIASCLDGKPKQSIILIITGIGCHAIDTPILMYDGTIKKVQDIELNDKLMGDDNTPRTVQELFRGNEQMVEIIPRKEKSFKVNMNHILSLKFTNLISILKRSDGCYKANPRYRLVWFCLNGENQPIRTSKMFKTYKEADEYKKVLYINTNVIQKGDIIDIKVNNLLKWNSWWLEKGNICLYKSNIVKFSEKILEIEPYMIGYWLGDGISSLPAIVSQDATVIKYFRDNLSQYNCYLQYQNGYTYRINGDTKIVKGCNYFKNILEKLNLLNNKHIPINYKTGSIDQRLQLLAGIIDSDGHYQVKSNQYEIVLINEQLIDDIIDVSKSLGFNCFKKQVSKTCTNSKNGPVTGTYYRIQIYGYGIETIPTKILRKQAHIRTKDKNPNLDGFDIKILDNDDFYGFELDGNHRYLTGDYFVHHNSNGKSFFFEFAKSILGPKYGIKMELAFLVDKRKKSGGPDPSLMALEHGRLAHYSETEQNEELNTARMKEITGQESLAGRNLFEAQKNFRPCCHHLITCNHHLSIRTTDHGTWRRIKTYKFKIVFGLNPDPNNKYERKSDPKVAEEYATDARYKEAFLSIIVEYYKKLQSKYNGNILNIPCETIAKETDEYRHNEDIISKFIDSRAVVSTNNTTSILDVVEIYKIWYIDNVGNNMTQNNQQLSNIILNSKLCKYFKTENKTYTLKGVRILGKNETPVQKEKFLSEVL